MSIEQPLIVRIKRYSDLQTMSFPPSTTQIHVVGTLTTGIYTELLKKNPGFKRILLSPSVLRILSPSITESARDYGIEFSAASLVPTNHGQGRTQSHEFRNRKRALETMNALGRQRLALLLKKKVVAAQMLAAHYGLDGSSPVNQKSLLKSNSNYRSNCQISHDIAAVFLCLNPTFGATALVRRRALKIYTAYLAEYELRPFMRQLKRLAKKLNR